VTDSGDWIVRKESCDAFHATDLQEVLDDSGARRPMIAGCMTQYCVDTTCRRAVSLGFDVLLAADGHLNGGPAGLTFWQVIDHHNEVMDDFEAGARSVQVLPVAGLVALLTRE
jgi:nicotinamidase-related amidase